MTHFDERQRLSPIILGLTALALVIGYAVTVMGDMAPDERLVVTIAFAAGAVILLGALSLSLRTTVTDEGVRVKGLIFIDRLIPFAEITSAESVRYRPILDYGGWGYRLSPKGKAYNMRGDKGVALSLKDGGKIMLGSQRPDELAEAITARL